MEKLRLYKKHVEYLQERRKIKQLQQMKISRVPEKSIIPLDIYQFWHDDNLPDCLIESTNNKYFTRWIKSKYRQFNVNL